MGCAIALVSLGIGYLVLTEANREKKNLKQLGQIIAVLIIVGSLGSAIVGAMKYVQGGGQCGMGKYSGTYSKGMMCSVSGKHKHAEAAT